MIVRGEHSHVDVGTHVCGEFGILGADAEGEEEGGEKELEHDFDEARCEVRPRRRERFRRRARESDIARGAVSDAKNE